MSGKGALNRISTTLPRTEITAPRFEGVIVFFMVIFADPPSGEFKHARLFRPGVSHSILPLLHFQAFPEVD
jgi:hypothetical protein